MVSIASTGNVQKLDRVSAAFALSASITFIFNTLLAWVKDSVPALNSFMASLTGHHWTTQARRAEGQGRRKSSFELGFVTGVEQRLKGRTVLGVGVARDPRRNLGAERRVHKTGITRVRSAPREAAAD